MIVGIAPNLYILDSDRLSGVWPLQVQAQGSYRGIQGLRGCPETSPPRCEAFKPLFGDIGKQDKNAVKACSA